MIGDLIAGTEQEIAKQRSVSPSFAIFAAGRDFAAHGAALDEMFRSLHAANLDRMLRTNMVANSALAEVEHMAKADQAGATVIAGIGVEGK
ncbi:hypothetical protein WG936_02560 [Corynebacterium sp. H127]|uniref:hypothetical protein n=1 Tax=Corynebacterium sp. H127 TaxID=3133418 RepID=UPI00309C5700